MHTTKYNSKFWFISSLAGVFVYKKINTTTVNAVSLAVKNQQLDIASMSIIDPSTCGSSKYFIAECLPTKI